ncbi:MAG: type II toxin-antitoxin system PrlF family antitoxin [Syntrophobacteraceae bacterium]
MAASLEVESKLTDRYQTTVPETVRRALKLDKGDRVRYTLRQNGEVVLTRATSAEEDDPLLGRFLEFLAQDIASHPERLQAVDACFVNRIHSLIGGVEIDLHASLSENDE